MKIAEAENSINASILKLKVRAAQAYTNAYFIILRF